LKKIGGKKSWKTFANLQNVTEKSFIKLQVLPVVKINTRISDTPCISRFSDILSNRLDLETVFRRFFDGKENEENCKTKVK
jgi:hypothetical protein